MKRLVLIPVEALDGAAHVCSPLCQWLRPAEAATCTLFEKPLIEHGPRYERLGECVDAEPKSTAYLDVVKGNPDALEVLAARCADLTWAHEQTRNALDSSRAQCDALKDQLRDAEQALRDVAECFESLDRLKEAAEKVRG